MKLREVFWKLCEKVFARELFWERHEAFCRGWTAGCHACLKEGEEVPPPPDEMLRRKQEQRERHEAKKEARNAKRS